MCFKTAILLLEVPWILVFIRHLESIYPLFSQERFIVILFQAIMSLQKKRGRILYSHRLSFLIRKPRHWLLVWTISRVKIWQQRLQGQLSQLRFLQLCSEMILYNQTEFYFRKIVAEVMRSSIFIKLLCLIRKQLFLNLSLKRIQKIKHLLKKATTTRNYIF